MDQKQTLFLTLFSIFILLSFISLIQNTFNLLSSVRLQNLEAAGDKRAKLILNLLDNQNRIFLTIKVIKLLLVVCIILAINYLFNDQAFWLIFVISLLVLSIIEVFALAFSKVNPDRTILTFSKVIDWLLILFYPLYLITSVMLKLFSIFLKPEVENIITEQELLNIIDEAQLEGGLQESEGELIRRSIEFNDLLAEEILTPRVELVALDIKWDQERVMSILDDSEYSRYPVYKDSIDTIIGVVHTKDFKKIERDFDLKAIIKPVIFVPESYKISKLLQLIQQNKSHLAVVIDEYGGTAGIVTLEDIVEELVGEIWDEHDEEEREITQVNPHQYIVLASVELYKLKDELEIDLESDASTVGGWIVELLGKIPPISEEITYNNLKMTVLDADQKKVIKLLIDIKEGENQDEESD